MHCGAVGRRRLERGGCSARRTDLSPRSTITPEPKPRSTTAILTARPARFELATSRSGGVGWVCTLRVESPTGAEVSRGCGLGERASIGPGLRAIRGDSGRTAFS